ncbi:hypothetical protein FA95DRAFT_1613011 [Auriscalpium vulgare]|uniref:Uncharacterized protein n=1 Tax=Auriscalpium vulgare TaxID=40419 RepID=A0ACB8R5R0_9AGAM|nr:hypothetical protein FA95DRAFT_1613011 [Auriscalpium vulgare]
MTATVARMHTPPPPGAPIAELITLTPNNPDSSLPSSTLPGACAESLVPPQLLRRGGDVSILSRSQSPQPQP